jgi:hypothetical protein
MITVLYSNTFAQISEGGIPPSFHYSETKSSAGTVEKVPVNFYIEDLRETDGWQAREGVPMPVAKLIDVDYSPENSGKWITLPGGERIWKLELEAQDAVAIMLYYNDFLIPEGGKLFIYSNDKSHLLGAYTHGTHPDGGLFATEFVSGDRIVLEYVAPENGENKPEIRIGQIGYGYNQSALRALCLVQSRKESGDCEVNINCEEGDAWQNEKRGICHTVQKIGNAAYICTASLVNNTAQDLKPLIITAMHCSDDGSKMASANDMLQWLFYFDHELEGCDNNSSPIDCQSMTGCTLLAGTELNGESDGMLLLLRQVIPDSYNVYYNGWDRSSAIPQSGVGIHHPEGDYKKISTYGQPATIETFDAGDIAGENNAHFNVTFMQTANGYGVTEKGSSGSPLFNQNKLIVGTLSGGNSSCSYPRGLNLYGRLYYHWDRYNTDSLSQMSVWLDPINSGVQTLAGRYNTAFKPAPVNLQIINQGLGMYLEWDMPGSSSNVERYYVYRNNRKIGETTTNYFPDSDPLHGSNTYAVSAIYAGGEESEFVTASVDFVKYQPPLNLRAERVATSRVRLTWDAPEFEQTIYWGSMDITYGVSFENGEPFYFGQVWQPDELTLLHRKTVKAVQFVPDGGNTYEIYIRQGERIYRQAVEPSSLQYLNINTVNLATPYVIDASMPLFVTVHAVSVGSDYPAVCDNGPVVDGKGNIYSFDGNTWMKLYEEDEPGDFNYNFIVTAIVSSVEGELPVQDNSRTAASAKILKSSRQNVRSAKIGNAPASVSLRSSQPKNYPEVTRYKLFRINSSFSFVQAPATSYSDVTSSNQYTYQVSALYGDSESAKSNIANIVTVDIPSVNDSVDILPSAFSNSVRLKGYEYVTKIDVFSATGAVNFTIDIPSQTINTSSLSPGIYFFRIYGDNGKVLKVAKTVKVN